MEFESLLRHVAEFGSVVMHVDRGEFVYYQGGAGNDMFIVISGRLRVVYNLGKADEKVVGEIGRGEPVGETALLDGGDRTASVVAIRHSQLARISKAAFEFLLAEHPGDLVELIRVSANRLRRSYESGMVSPLPSCIAVIAVNRESPLEAYCERFVGALSETTEQCRHLSARKLPAEFSDGEATTDRQAKLASWLNEQEIATSVMVLEADYDLTPWTRRCLRHADLVILLAEADSDPKPGEVEAALDEYSEPVTRPRVELVLLQHGSPYAGTAAWLEPRRVDHHHHVRMESRADRERLKRILNRSDICLALGGGGARGFAHIGLLRAFEELGLPIDRVCGTSIGAVIGGWIAKGADSAEIAAQLRQHFVEGGSLRSPTLPAISIDTGRRYVRALERMFGDTLIEDMPIDYFCVSCNLSRGHVVTHRKGSLAKWIGVSMSVPGVAPPYVQDGELLVDGGVLNNIPFDIAHDDGAGRVIGVDVSPEVDLTLPVEYQGRPGAWEIIRTWLPSFANRRRPRAPGIIAVLNRVSSLTSITNIERNRHRAELLIQMPVSDYKMFAWDKIDELVELGYRVGMEKLRPLADDQT